MYFVTKLSAATLLELAASPYLAALGLPPFLQLTEPPPTTLKRQYSFQGVFQVSTKHLGLLTYHCLRNAVPG